jgi:hypothetical protein
LQCSKFGKTSKLAQALKQRRFLIQISPRFKPAALIGAQPQGLHCAANIGLVGSFAVKARLAYFVACF